MSPRPGRLLWASLPKPEPLSWTRSVPKPPALGSPHRLAGPLYQGEAQLHNQYQQQGPVGCSETRVLSRKIISNQCIIKIV